MISSGKSRTFSLRSPSSPFGGYDGRGSAGASSRLGVSDSGGGGGGIVDDGLGEVRAYTLAAAVASAYVLNSAVGVMFPGTLTAPPITRIDFALISVRGECDAARAMFVSGPIAMTEIVSGGFSSRIRSISRCDGRKDGVKSDVGELRSSLVSDLVVEVISVSGGDCAKRLFHVSGGVRCLCWAYLAWRLL